MSSPFSAVNHIGFVVRDLQEGLEFFTDALGFQRIDGRAGALTPEGDNQTRRFGVHAKASGNYAFVRLADTVIELLEWTAPDRNSTPPLNSDLGGRHLAISVADMDVAIDRMRSVSGVVVREPNAMGYVYCETPLGLEIQLIPAS